MSKLGEYIGYTGEDCPNCGRNRVEAWTCGKRICEKCHWCIEDENYCREHDVDYYGDAEEMGYGLN